MTTAPRDRVAAAAVFAVGLLLWHGWLVPSHDFAPSYDKPILYHWLTALAYGAVGPTALGARLVSALAAFGTLAVVDADEGARIRSRCGPS